jgi:hypothetical protein
VQFLSKFVEHYGSFCRTVIITVPNAFRGGNVINIFQNREVINSDHRFFYTPYTLLKVATDSGLRPISVEAAAFSRVSSTLKQKLLNWRPLLAEDLILFADVV